MWGYVVLNGLNDQPTRSQAVLAETIGADKTRLIPVLDQLQRDGLINRERDPDDRRVHVALTPAGDTIRRAVQHDIQHNELQLLERLAPRARQQFLTALTILAQRPEQAFDPAQSG